MYDRIKVKRLDAKDQRKGSLINLAYCSEVWGKDIADNKKLKKDEKSIISKYLSVSFWNEEVLEVGCGTGRITNYLIKYTNHLVAIDYVKECIYRLQEQYPLANTKVNLINTLFQDLDFADGHFSCILYLENTISMTLSIDERIEIYQKLTALTKKGGLLLLAFRSLNKAHRKKNNYQLLYADEQEKMPAYIKCWTKRSFTNEIKKHLKCFSILEIQNGNRRPAGGRMYHVALVKN